MTDKLTTYQLAGGQLSESHFQWPLYGAGFDNFGWDGAPMCAPMPEVGALRADGRWTTAAEEEFLRQMLPILLRSTQ